MAVDGSHISRASRNVADYLDLISVSEIGPWPLFMYVDFIDNVKFSIETQRHPDHLRYRADRFDKQCKRAINGTQQSNEIYRAARWKPSTRRAKYSERVARQFLEDGERDNYEAYRALYERS